MYPRPWSSSQRATPSAAASPWALPPVKSTALTPSTDAAGWSSSLSRVPGPPPRTSAAATVPSGGRIRCSPYMRRDRSSGRPRSPRRGQPRRLRRARGWHSEQNHVPRPATRPLRSEPRSARTAHLRARRRRTRPASPPWCRLAPDSRAASLPVARSRDSAHRERRRPGLRPRRSHRGSDSLRVHPRPPQSLVRVDVADASHGSLIEQRCLDCGTRARKSL